MKQRKPWLIALLSLCTIFVYTVIWWYQVQKDIKEETNNGIMAIGHLMIMLVPGVNIVYYLIWICKVDSRLAFVGAPRGNRAFWYILLTLIGLAPFVVFPMIQSKINNIGLIEVREKTTAEARADKYAKYLTPNKK